MKKRIKKATLMPLLVLFILSASFAQKQTSTLSGIIIEKTEKTKGEPVPGATLTLLGPSMIGTRSYVSSENGRFRFPGLPPGKDYELKVEMPGFKTVIAKGLSVSLAETVDLTIVLELETITKEVLVIGQAPTVDTESAKASIRYDSELIQSIPMPLQNVLFLEHSIPTAVDAGSYIQTPMAGGSRISTFYQMDGIQQNDPGTGTRATDPPVDIFDEVEVEIGAHPAEVGQTDSVFINIVTKSGGNEFSGGMRLNYTRESFAEDLITPENRTVYNLYAPSKYADLKEISLSLGGPIIKDKLWFFVNGHTLQHFKRNSESPEFRLQSIAATHPGLFSSQELQHTDFNIKNWHGFAKFSFRPAKNISCFGAVNYRGVTQPWYDDTRPMPKYTWGYWHDWYVNQFEYTLQFTFFLDQNSFLEIKGIYMDKFFYYNGMKDQKGKYISYDRATDVYYGSYSNDNGDRYRDLAQGSITLTKYKDNFLGANHQFKIGAEYLWGCNATDNSKSVHSYWSYWQNHAANDPYYYSTSGKRGRLSVITQPTKRGQWRPGADIRNISGYVQDTIKKGRLAFNLGLRVENPYVYIPKQSRPEIRFDAGPELLAPGLPPNSLLEALINQYRQEIEPISPFDAFTTNYRKQMEFLNFSPRIGFVYDIFGTGKTAFKLAFSRYHVRTTIDDYSQGQLFGGKTVTWYWYDLNANKLMDLTPTDKYELTSYQKQDPDLKYYVDDLKSPYTDEIMAGIDHAMSTDLKLGLQFFHKKWKNLVQDTDANNGYDPSATDENGLIWIPYTVTDPGEDGKFGTNDDKPLTVYGLRKDRPIPTFIGKNTKEAKSDYWAFILNFEKRMSNRWQLKGSVLYCSNKSNVEVEYRPTTAPPFRDPNARINDYGSVSHERPLQIKIMGTYIFPYDFMVSTYFDYHSGVPWMRTISRIYFPPGFPVKESYVGVLAEPMGSRRTYSYTNLDLRIEKSLTFGKYGKLNFYVDIFNIMGQSGFNIDTNPDASLYYYQDPPRYVLGPSYGKVNSVYGVRSFNLGARWSF